MNLCRKSHQNRTMGKCSKIDGIAFGERGVRVGGNLENKCKCHKNNPKMNQGRKFHPDRTMEKC